MAGIGFYDIYDYTWGEVQDYCDAVAERHRQEDIRQARLLFTSCSVLSRLFGSSGGQIEMMTEYDWLFTAEEHKQAKLQRLLSIVEGPR